jgi:hypothetical protein
MANNSHDLQFSILVSRQRQDLEAGQRGQWAIARIMYTYFEALVLKDPLDGSILAAWHHFRLKDNTKRTIADDFTL